MLHYRAHKKIFSPAPLFLLTVMSASASGKYTFRVKAARILLTFPHHVVPYASYQHCIVRFNCTIASYVVESHQDRRQHTHIVLVTQEPTLWEAEWFQEELGSYPNIKRLSTDPDMYRAIADSCKHSVGDLDVNLPRKKDAVISQVLAELFKYIKRAKNAGTQANFKRQYHTMRQHWLGINPVNEDPYRSSQVQSENASLFFPSQ